MSSVRKVLLADPDLASVRALTRALRQKGCQVYSARDGGRALELAVLRHPDLVLFDRSCPVLDARTFVDILRTNPRTDTIPVVVTASAEQADEAMRDGPGALLRKPYNLDEVLAHIDDLLARAERARSEAAESQEIEGALAQLALPDLLQTLALARRTGRVTLRRGAERGEVELVEGRPVDARIGAVQGEKALFRMLGWTEGTFSFQPGPAAAEARFARGTDELLLEAARQMDECRRLLDALPPPTTRWVQAAGASLRAVPPIAREVLARLDMPRSAPELLDAIEAADLAVLQGLMLLHGEGLIVPVDADAPPAPEPLLTVAEAHAVRGRAQRGRASSRSQVLKIILAARDASAARESLSGLPLLAPEGTPADALGTVAELEVAEGLLLHFCIVPAGELGRPLWRPFTVDAAGLVVTELSPATLALARFVADEQHAPLATLGEACPDELARRGASAHPGAREAVRAVLLAYAGLTT
ncbi:MAG TPA: response regulator [Myxococcaceae bacterium]|nr:response regulator [Myxococcaceae bacterium]